jgi:hypothetical protein
MPAKASDCVRSVRGLETGDIVRVELPRGDKAKPRRTSRPFVPAALYIGNADGINAKYCKLLHRADGYGHA